MEIKDIVNEVITKTARKEALEILNLSEKEDIDKFTNYYYENNFNACCMHLDYMKDKLVHENKIKQSDNDSFGGFYEFFL